MGSAAAPGVPADVSPPHATRDTHMILAIPNPISFFILHPPYIYRPPGGWITKNTILLLDCHSVAMIG